MRRSWHPAAGLSETAWGLAWLLLTYVFVPLPALVPELNDTSWQAWLTEAFLRRLQFGTSVVFTYGCWGFLFEPRGAAEILPWLRGGRFVLALGMSAGAGFLFARLIHRPVPRFLALTVFLTLADPGLILPVLLAFVLFDFRLRLPRALLVILIPACALAGHVKFTTLWLLVPLIALRFLSDLLLERRVPLQPLAFAACYCGWYAAAGQDFARFRDYFAGATLITSGYEGAMALPGSPVFLLMSLLLAALLVWFVFAGPLRSRSWPAVLGAAWFGFALFAGLKMIFVRYDAQHFWMGMGEFILPVALVVSLLPGAPSNSLLRPAIAALAFVLAVVPFQAHILLMAASRAWASLTVLTPGPPATTLQARAKDEIRRRFPMPNLPGEVDVAPLGHSIALAYDWDLNARPVPVSYSTYSPELAALNERFFESPSAPEHLLLALHPIDDHFPTLEDSLAWRPWLARYQVVKTTPSFLVLKRRPRGLLARVDALWEGTAVFGQSIAIPPVDERCLVWARFRISSSFPLWILSRLWRPEILALEVQSRSRTRRYRFIPGAAEGGFLLSPLIETLDSMAAIFPGTTSSAPPSTVERFTLLRTEVFTKTYSQTYSVTLSRYVLAEDREAASPPPQGMNAPTNSTSASAADRHRESPGKPPGKLLLGPRHLARSTPASGIPQFSAAGRR